ncbi:hypothetical protein M413DRAFT_131426 [Hebeloma cylindrosporum]|uniref:Uncharacterized protein n=1 Tax=Hebeloma cylindrosporum TaxID=76867 RepID=A0A0C3CFC7_HEBCY|nr:hypothetical protein M413DRAFT_131426 [Hebeloma cylindrosporum h7]
MTSTSGLSQWSMATHPQYDNARKRRLREERNNRLVFPSDSIDMDEGAAVNPFGGTATDLRKTAPQYLPKPDVEGIDPALKSDGQGRGQGDEERMGSPPPSIKLEGVEEKIALAQDVPGALTDNTPLYPVQIAGPSEPIIDRRERELDWRSGEIDRRERELERRERELERRERELHRRERALVDEKTRWAVIQNTTGVGAPAHWQNAIEDLRNQIRIDLLAERKENRDREIALEAKIMKQVEMKEVEYRMKLLRVAFHEEILRKMVWRVPRFRLAREHKLPLGSPPAPLKLSQDVQNTIYMIRPLDMTSRIANLCQRGKSTKIISTTSIGWDWLVRSQLSHEDANEAKELRDFLLLVS